VLLELPERTRQIFVLRRLEGLSYFEIGRRLGVSVSAVEKHMQRAVRHLAARTGDPK
jgi:RNA polymerase sigma factor (sigma-70 family)